MFCQIHFELQVTSIVSVPNENNRGRNLNNDHMQLQTKIVTPPQVLHIIPLEFVEFVPLQPDWAIATDMTSGGRSSWTGHWGCTIRSLQTSKLTDRGTQPNLDAGHIIMGGYSKEWLYISMFQCNERLKGFGWLKRQNFRTGFRAWEKVLDWVPPLLAMAQKPLSRYKTDVNIQFASGRQERLH